MAEERLAQIFIDIIGRTEKLEKEIQDLKKTTRKEADLIGKELGNGIKKSSQKSFKENASFFSRTWKNSIGLVIAEVAFLSVAFVGLRNSISAAINQKRAILQIDQAVKQTGYSAGFTSQELQRIAANLQDINGIGDETFLRSVTANLLTFTNISGVAFKRAQQAVADVNAVINQGSIAGLSSQAIQLGKALNDPIANLGALGRAGIQFSEVQKEQIKNFAKAGELGKAQAIILDEIERQYGGQAKALNDAAAGTTNLTNAWGDLKEAIGAAFTPLLNDILPQVTKAIKGWIDYLTPYSEKLKQIQVTYEQQQEFLKQLEGTDQAFRDAEKKRLQESIDKYNELIKKNQELKKVAYQPFGATNNVVDIYKLDQEITTSTLLLKQYEAQLQAIDKFNAGDRAGQKPNITPTETEDERKKRLEKEAKERQQRIENLNKLKSGANIQHFKQADETMGPLAGITDADPNARGGGLSIIGEQARTEFADLTVEGNEFTATLQAGIESVGDSIKSNITQQLSQAIIEGRGLDNIFKGIMSQLLNVGISAGLNAILPGSGFLTQFLGAHDGGSFINTGGNIKKMAGGGSFIVPGGFPNDSYPLLVESGERVKVTPSGRAGNDEKLLATINKSIQAMNLNLMNSNSRVARLEANLSTTVDGDDLKFVYDRATKLQGRYS